MGAWVKRTPPLAFRRLGGPQIVRELHQYYRGIYKGYKARVEEAARGQAAFYPPRTHLWWDEDDGWADDVEGPPGQGNDVGPS